MSRRDKIARAWDEAQRRDLRDLPHEPALVRPGSFGTFPEDTRRGGPRAPTLDSGPLYTGEWREEIRGDETEIPASADVPYVIVAQLRRPWPYVGFAVDTSGITPAAEQSLTVGLLLLTRSGPAKLVGNVIGGTPPPPPQLIVTAPAFPFPWIGMSGILAGERVAIYVTNNFAEPVTIKANLWGYNAPGFGP